MRYQECGLLRKIWRRQWKFWYTFVFFWWITKWIYRGAKNQFGWSRWEEIKVMWSVSRGTADIKMKHTWTWDEAKKRLI